jgi:hypothetical protein
VGFSGAIVGALTYASITHSGRNMKLFKGCGSRQGDSLFRVVTAGLTQRPCPIRQCGTGRSIDAPENRNMVGLRGSTS